MSVKITQCLCPHRHCILALAFERETAAEIEEQLRQFITETIADGRLNPWCGICGSPVSEWFYQNHVTKFASLEEAMPHLKQQEERQLALAEAMKQQGRAFEKARLN